MTPPLKSRGWLAKTGPSRATGFAGYSRFVRIAKLVLPFAALIIIGIVIARLSHNPQQQILTELPKTDTTTPGQSEVIKAQYEGRDADGQPYTLIAASAARSMEDPDTILLVKPHGDITLKDKSWIAVESAAGAYNTKKSKLDLTGGVALFHDQGYEMHLDSVSIDLTEKTALSQTPVTAQGPLGLLSAANMKIVDGGNLVIFGGPATMTLNRLGKEKG